MLLTMVALNTYAGEKPGELGPGTPDPSPAQIQGADAAARQFQGMAPRQNIPTPGAPIPGAYLYDPYSSAQLYRAYPVYPAYPTYPVYPGMPAPGWGWPGYPGYGPPVVAPYVPAPMIVPGYGFYPGYPRPGWNTQGMQPHPHKGPNK